jgi:hypothetical protein
MGMPRFRRRIASLSYQELSAITGKSVGLLCKMHKRDLQGFIEFAESVAAGTWQPESPSREELENALFNAHATAAGLRCGAGPGQVYAALTEVLKITRPAVETMERRRFALQNMRQFVEGFTR